MPTICGGCDLSRKDHGVRNTKRLVGKGTWKAAYHEFMAKQIPAKRPRKSKEVPNGH